MDQNTQNSKLSLVAIEFFSGLCGGWLQVLVGQPFDTIKVRLQNQCTFNPIYKSTSDCFQQIVKCEGAKSLYKGTLSPLLGVGAVVSIQFGVAENMKKLFASDDDVRLPMHLIFLSGSMSGAVISSVQSVTEHFRIKMQLQTGEGKQLYSGSLNCGRNIYSNYGLRGVFRGFVPTFLRETIGCGVYFSVFEYLTRLFYNENETIAHCTNSMILFAGGAAGVASWGITYPLDVVKTKIQGDSFELPKFKGMLDCFRQTSRDGMRAFFPGFLICMMRAAPANGVTFLGFESSMSLLGARVNFSV